MDNMSKDQWKMPSSSQCICYPRQKATGKTKPTHVKCINWQVKQAAELYGSDTEACNAYCFKKWTKQNQLW